MSENKYNQFDIYDEELRDYEYEDIESKGKKNKIIKIILCIILVLFVAFFVIKSCSNSERVINVDVTNNEKNLLSAGKKYFKSNFDEVPSAVGSCKEVTLNDLIIAGKLKKDNFTNCHGTKTKVKLCILENKKEQYTPILMCDEITTEFTEWQEGKPSDVVKDMTDVRFTFLGSVLDKENTKISNDEEEYWQGDVPYQTYKTKNVTTYYKTRDKYYIWNINKKNYYPNGSSTASGTNKYYISSPSSEFTYKDSAGVAYKYYKNGSKIYWNGGSYKMTSPGDGYIYKDRGVNVTTYRTRTWTKTGEIIKPTTIYICENSAGATKILRTPCSADTSGYTKQNDSYLSCDGKTKTSLKYCGCVSGTVNVSRNECGNYSNWSSYDTKPKCNASDTCEVLTRSTYKWYKYTRVYSPTGSSSARGTNVYYTAAPGAGYVKDALTGTTAYKWYRLIKVGTKETLSKVAPESLATYAGTKWGEWSTYSTTKPVSSLTTEVKQKNKLAVNKIDSKNANWMELSDKYVKEEELIELFNKKKIQVKSLEDIILKNGEAKYEVKMYYRNRK